MFLTSDGDDTEPNQTTEQLFKYLLPNLLGSFLDIVAGLESHPTCIISEFWQQRMDKNWLFKRWKDAAGENGRIDGSINGVPTGSVPLKLLLAFQALDDIAFAYPYSIVFFRNTGYGEVAVAGEQGYEKSFGYCDYSDNLLLPRVWMLWLCRFWERYTGKPID
ncbi:hypothetical protein L1887_30345 [Cichorium endivia]|nr:hypothetical protein L1887_30345 [Cichorium endivia]